MKKKFDIITLDSVDSTNTYIKTHPDLWERPFCAVVAREQTGGRGRHGRSWHSDPGRDLTFSMVYVPDPPFADVSCVTLIAGLAVYRALKGRVDEGLNVKWPNDILHNRRKIGGILCEAVFSGSRPIVIIGIGVNINRTSFSEEIRSTASSLKEITGADHDIGKILEDILANLAALLAGFKPPLSRDLMREWTSASQSIGKPIRFTLDGMKMRGLIDGIEPDGSLRIAADSGDTISGFRGEALFDDDI